MMKAIIIAELITSHLLQLALVIARCSAEADPK
jgi:hypothetical protein